MSKSKSTSTKKAVKTTATKATKAPAKKAPAKKTAETKSSKTIAAKSVGQNVILVIDGKKFSKRFPDASNRNKILAEVELYNKKNTLKKEKEIIEIMMSGKSTETERKEKVDETIQKLAVTKVKTEKPKEATTTASTDAVLMAKALLEKDGYTVTKITAKPSRREY